MTNENLKSFKKELKELLEKYDVFLDVNLDGDTENLLCKFAVSGNTDGSEHILNENSYLEVSDLKE